LREGDDEEYEGVADGRVEGGKKMD